MAETELYFQELGFSRELVLAETGRLNAPSRGYKVRDRKGSNHKELGVIPTYIEFMCS